MSGPSAVRQQGTTRVLFLNVSGRIGQNILLELRRHPRFAGMFRSGALELAA